MKKNLLLLFVCLFGALGGVEAWTGVPPETNRWYLLYNTGVNKYWYGTNSTYDVTENISNATPVRVESGIKLAFYSGGNTTYRIYQDAGTGGPSNQSGVNFTLQGDENGYRLESKHTTKGGDDYTRDMKAGGSFPRVSYHESNVTWQFAAYEDVLPSIVVAKAPTCASTAATIVSGWERVTTKEQLAQNPERYFYAIFSAVNPGVMMTTEYNDSKYRMCYKAAGNPLSSSSYDLFEMENYDGEFAIKSNITGKYYGNTSGAPWDFQANQETLNEGCKVTVTCSNGVYNLQDKYADAYAATDPFVGNYLGAWDNMEFVGERLAGNKGQSRAGYFLIYRKLKKNVDLTSRITNHSFETGNKDGWTDDSGTPNMDIQTNKELVGMDGDYYIEKYWENIALDLNQTIQTLPVGYYRIAARALAHDGNSIVLYAKAGNNDEATTSITSVDDYYVDVCLSTPGSIKIGIKGSHTATKWVAADNFRLTYLGGMEDLTPVIGKMNADVNTAQQNAISTYNSNKTVANYIAAQEAIANAEASVAAYANAASYLEKVEQLLATTNFYSQDAYNSVYGTSKTAYDAGTMEDATARGLNYKTPSYTPAEARYTANTPNDLLIPGWTIGGNDAKTSGSGFYINTWSNEDASFANPFYEYWTSETSLSETTLVGTKTGLTANKLYRVTANVRIQGTVNSGKIKMQVGSGDEIDVTKGNQIGTTNRYMKEYVAVGMTDAYGNLTLKFTVESESGISWLSFRDVMYAEQDDDFTYIIKQADCNTTSQEFWPGNGRTTATGEHYSGDENRVYFTFTSGEDRHQDVTFPVTGKYLLKTAVRCKVANTIATMSVGTASATTNFASSENCYVIGTDGSETTNVNSDGGNWVYNELYFDANAGDVKTITIQLTSKDNVGETDCGGMTLTYFGTEGTLVGMEVSAVAKAGTFVAPFDVVIPARTTAYTVKAAGNGYITLKEEAAAGATLAANTPVILYAEDGIASKISKQFYGTATGSANENGNGYLIGMYNAGGTIDAGAQNYVMQYNSIAGKPEFRQVTTANFATTANRSYLKLNVNSESRVVIKFDGEDPTAINAIEAAETEDGALKDGKYLIEGKIVLVKNGVKYGANGQKLN